MSSISLFVIIPNLKGLPRWLSGKESACWCRRCSFNPSLGKIPWRRKWQHTPVFLPGKSHIQKRLAGYSLWGHKELDMTEWLSAHTLTYTTHTYPTEYPTYVYWKITCNNFEGTVFYRGKTLQTIKKSNKCKTDNYIMEYLLRWKWIS